MLRALAGWFWAGIFLCMGGQPLQSDEPRTRADALPAGALCRFGASRFLNFGRTFALAFSPDGQTLAAGGWDGTGRLWEVASGKELHRFQDQKSPVRVMAFSPDGKMLASTAQGAAIVLRDAVTGAELRRLKGHRGLVTFVQFAPDGKLLASKGYDMTFRLWDPAGGREVRRFTTQDSPQQEQDPDCHMAFASDGKTVISATFTREPFGDRRQRTFRVWEVATGAEVRSFKDDSPAPGPVGISPDNTILAAAARESPGRPRCISLWDVETGKALRPIELPEAEHVAAVSSLVFSPDGKTLAASGAGPILIWEIATRREIGRLPISDTGPIPMAFSPSGRLLASGSTDITVLLWDLTGRAQKGKLRSENLALTECRTLWNDLTSPDASKPRQALWKLVAGGDGSVSFLRTNLHPAVSPASPESIARLVAELDDPQFDVRAQAKARLLELAELAEPALLEAQKKHPSLELRQRIDQLLNVIVDDRSRPSGDRLRGVRAIAILEQINTPAARQALRTLGGGAAAALLTRQAQDALARLKRQAIAK